MRTLITGSTDGIGKETAKTLSKKGFSVIIHGRDSKKVEDIQTSLHCEGVLADFACLKEIDNIVSYIEKNPVDILINNAGVYNKNYKQSCDNIELTFAVNYLAHFYLTFRLLSKKIFPKIIINISSMVHTDYIDLDDIVNPKSYDANEAYAVSKLCNILFTYHLATKFKHFGILVNAMHPGVINTKMLVDNWGSIGDSVEKGAQNVANTLESIQNNSSSGMYFVNAKPTKSKNISYSASLQKQLWVLSLKLCHLSDIKLD